ncbi:MAG: SAM-dependent DNA methyltransferase, partial [Planctomycetes bacterium]|nr:SAM-dependent DNA methyltransferase [Planctomycetota bacterium]
MPASPSRLTAARLRPYLGECGYGPGLIEANLRLAQHSPAALVAFAHAPFDSRSACIAVIDGFTDPLQDAVACRPLGAPVILVCFPDRLQWWTQGTTRTELRESVPASQIGQFFEQRRKWFAPEAIYRAKTLGRFDKNFQLEFVDLGLMPLVEAEAGRTLERIVERAVLGTKSRLGWRDVSLEQGHWLLKSNFWLLAAKILRDKGVPAFAGVNLEDLDQVYHRLAKHYGAAAPVEVGTKQKREALRESARQLSQVSPLRLVSTEALAYLYENALITRETRAELATHSTPTYLVDYVIGKLRPWIEEIETERRRVFEPACGHAAFLLAAMRLLGELLPSQMSTPGSRHRYLRERLWGCDIDSFALEIARLCLTLADVPNPNGWGLRGQDMFAGHVLADGAREAAIVLSNPPFTNFSRAERSGLAAAQAEAQRVNKAAEMLWRIVTNLQPGAVFGVILPQGLLHSQDARTLREFLAKDFEIAEICLFPDKVFTFSDAESVAVLGRRLRAGRRATRPIKYRRIREVDVERFKQAYEVTNEVEVSPSRFCPENGWDFLVPDLEEVWEFCRRHIKFRDVADIGQGLIFRSRNDPLFPRKGIAQADRRQKGFLKGFARLRETLETHGLPDTCWLNLHPSVIRRPVRGTTTGIPQLLLNYAPVSRGPWRLKAFMDRKGHPVTSRFLVIRPK